MSSKQTYGTLAGVGAILCWCSTIGFLRLVTESLGPMTAGAAVCLLAGAIGSVYILAHPVWRAKLRAMPRRYVIGCGSLFVLYELALYGALGLATGREQAMQVGVINYLWPGLTLVLAIPILGKRARPLLPLGVAIALAGVFVAIWPGGSLSWATAAGALSSDGWPYLLALIAAVTWALYSVLTRRWAGKSDGMAIPLFVLASGLVMAPMHWALGESSRLTWQATGALALTVLFPTLLGYVLWDVAMRRGNVTLVAALAYLTPILSAVVACVVLAVLPPVELWIGAVLVTAGAVICKLTIR